MGGGGSKQGGSCRNAGLLYTSDAADELPRCDVGARAGEGARDPTGGARGGAAARHVVEVACPGHLRERHGTCGREDHNGVNRSGARGLGRA